MQTLESRITAEADQMRQFFRDHGLGLHSLRALFDGLHQGANALHDQAIAATPDFKVGCEAGCGYCCHTIVSVTPAEAFYVWGRLQERDDFADLRASARATDAKTRGKTGAERYEGRMACAFLDADSFMCRIHPVRPLVCRAMHSGDRGKCLEAYDNRDSTVPTPTLKAFFTTNQVFFSALRTVLWEQDMRQVDLMAALAIIDDTPDAFMTWAKGGDLFAPAVLPEGPPVRRVAAETTQ